MSNFSDFSRDRFVVALDANSIKRATGATVNGSGFDWCRVDKSETFSLDFNPQTTTKKYIDSKNDHTSIDSYAPSMGQEIIIDGNNALYALMYEFAMNFPTGSDAEVPAMLVMPSVGDPSEADAFLWEHALITAGSINTQDKKLTFTINFNGEMKRGTGTKGAGGKFEFEAASTGGGSVLGDSDD